MNRDDHQLDLAGGGVENYGVRLNRANFAVQDSVGRFRILHYVVFVALDEFANYCFGEPLLDAISRGVILECGNRERTTLGRKARSASRNTITPTAADKSD